MYELGFYMIANMLGMGGDRISLMVNDYLAFNRASSHFDSQTQRIFFLLIGSNAMFIATRSPTRHTSSMSKSKHYKVLSCTASLRKLV
jgi:hypothetical protein